jgi:hypothetical protein
LTGNPNPFSAEEYFGVPHLNAERPIYEKLMDVITILVQYYNNATSTPADTLAIDTTLSELWLQYETEAASRPQPISWTTESNERVYRDAFTAYIVSYFSSARVLLSVTLQNQHSQVPPEGYINDSCASILECAQFLDTQSVGCAYVRIMVPLLLVALHGTDERQRQLAIGMFERWQRTGIVSGLCTLALQKVNQSSLG